MRVISDKDSTTYRMWNPREEGQSVADGRERDEELRLIKTLKLENLIRARGGGSVARTQQVRRRGTPDTRVAH